MDFLGNQSILCEIAKGIKFAVDYDWTSKNSQHVQPMGFFREKKRWFFRKRILTVSLKPKVASLP